jgi:hypothetical protein
MSGPVPGRGPAVEKLWIRWMKLLTLTSLAAERISSILGTSVIQPSAWQTLQNAQQILWMENGEANVDEIQF